MITVISLQLILCFILGTLKHPEKGSIGELLKGLKRREQKEGIQSNNFGKLNNIIVQPREDQQGGCFSHQGMSQKELTYVGCQKSGKKPSNGQRLYIDPFS